MERFARKQLRTRMMTVYLVGHAGGLTRLISVFVVGWPNPVFTASMVLELVIVPLVLWCHAHVVGIHKAQ